MSLGRIITLSALTFAMLAGCQGGPPAEVSGPDPRDTARALLELHGLLGRQPEERTEQQKQGVVDRVALGALIADLDARDGFTTDLYVGFLVGALARHQTRLFVSREGNRARVSAGKAAAIMRLEGGRWRILLDESIPQPIKDKAAAEKKQFDEARARAGAVPPPSPADAAPSGAP